MEIRDQMTATVRLTKQAAQRLKVFVDSLKTPPKNMNDALNLALSDLPRASFIDEIVALQQDKRKSLVEINNRFRSAAFLKRSEHYFLVMMARQAAWLSKKEQVRHQSIQAVLEMTLDLWELCNIRDPEGHHEGYMLGNLSGRRSDGTSHALRTHIPAYIEQTKSHPYPGTLEFALRNPEVMLRDDLVSVEDFVINQKMSKYYDVVYPMAVRCFFLETKQPLILSDKQSYFEKNSSGSFGRNGKVYYTHGFGKNFGFMISFEHVNVAANNIVEAEEFFAAFTHSKPKNSYRGENFSLLQTEESSHFQGGFIFQTHMLQTAIARADYDDACEAIAAMLADPQVQAALKETYERYGTI